MKSKILKKAIKAPDFLNDPAEYNKSFSRGLKIELNGSTILEISGTASINERGKSIHIGNFSAQAKRTFDNLTALLGSAGAGWHDVVKTRCYLRNMRDYDKFNKYRNQFYKKQKLALFPASICVEAGLCRPELLVEIEATAILGKK
ncbi:hypothetical protein EPN54_05925 [bacterium]|nr:MAG: hypothetical protein EPN54_05925 [bacterium]